ncbi:MAG TPA: hypothetical protein VKV03_04795 [Candidatus Binataceae bacterium]|nr:hypothetical protein [Candidatus Binataceae bacterium]
METPKVNSPLLSKILETAGPRISQFTATLDAISHDILMIEKLLLESGIRYEAAVPFLRSAYEDGTFPDGPAAALMWFGGEDGKTWRIYFVGKTSIWDSDAHEWREKREEREVRPLIETTVRIRLAADEPLSRLVAEVAEPIPQERIARDAVTLKRVQPEPPRII